MNIAITGSSGFLGSYLVESCKDRKIPYTEFNKKKHNLLNPVSLKNLVKGADAVIHLAAVNRGTNLELVQVNTLGTLSVLEAILRYSPNTKLIFASSFQVYLEDSLYGKSKMFAEKLIEYYSQKFGVKALILRISNIYGPGGKPFYNSVISTFAYLIKKHQPITINGRGLQKRDFIYVGDVTDALIRGASKKQKKPIDIIDICYGHETSLRELVKLFQRVFPKKVKVVYNTRVEETSWNIPRKTYKKASKLLGWKPKVSLEEGIKKVIAQ